MAAEVLLTRAFVDYVKLTRGADRAEMLYEHPMWQPSVPGSQDVVWEAARAPSLEDYVKTMAWMHPLYAPLREALVSGQYGDAFARQALQATLTRVRAIPAKPAGRYVLVDTAGARLWMYEDGKPVDSMKVVVGKADHATPMMAGFIRYAISNPYWNVPTELVRTKTAPAVLSQGMAYLKVRGYEVLSGWDDEATVVDPRTVDWKAVASGAIELRVRQRPNAGNAMGKVKYEFPNQLGIYLHDTPEKNLMLKDARQFSNGCIRLEDADRLGRWLLRQPLPSAGAPEQRIDLPEPVPVYVTYLTALPTDGHIAFVQDPYGRDAASRPMLAAQGGAAVAAR
jgi:murein L,D-transpeptidase YcbB/YkuD